MPIILLGGAGLGAYYLFFTDTGKDLIASLTKGGGLDFEGISKSAVDAGYDDPFKYMTGSKAKAWDPESDLYKDIQKRIGRNAKERRKIEKKEALIESYIADAYY